MLFQLPSFLLFFIINIAIIKMVDRRWIKAILLVTSVIFYASWNVSYIYIIMFYILFGIMACRIARRYRNALPALVILALSPLVFFKYTNFILQSLGIAHPISLGLPLGISFITFTLISMIVDYSRTPKTCYGALDIGLYICIFPHLIAGPILRSQELVPQLDNIKVCWRNLSENLPLFAIGMIKKVLIADQIGTVTDAVFADPLHHSFYDLLTAAIGFSVQIYCDFSAYSDMAIALAGMLGIKFPENFRSPYLSFSLTELWKRWHMTLSFWLRDYVFIPLVRHFRHSLPYLPLLLTMLLSGLWHGSKWSFVLWGGIQGIIMIAEGYTGYHRYVANNAYLKPFCIICNFVIWTLLLVLFRSSSIDSATCYYQSLLSFHNEPLNQNDLLVMALSAATLAFHKFDQAYLIRAALKKAPPALLIPMTIIIIISCSLVAAQRPESFYYFDF